MQHPYLIYLLVTLAVWWPGGFNIGPLTDGWMGIYDFHILTASFSVRALQRMPLGLGLGLTPGSFVGAQLVLFVLTLLRGILGFEIGKRLFPRQPPLGLIFGLLALFHPADRIYFWVDWLNVDTAWALALAACLAALIYLQSGALVALEILWLLQLACCFTYSGLMLVLLAFPVCVWALRRFDGEKTRIPDLWKTTLVVLACIILVVVLAARGVGREAQVSDFGVLKILDGFSFQFRSLFSSVGSAVAGMRWMFLLYGVIPAILMYPVAHRVAASAGLDGVGRSWKSHAALCAALLVLAGASYLPYSVSNLRYDDNREMLGAGMFVYAAMLLPVFTWLSRRRFGTPVACLMAALFTLFTTAVGLGVRDWNVSSYRSEEALLAGVAAALPRPAPGALVVVKLDDAADGRRIAGFYGRPQALISALRLMYGDPTLDGAFIDARKWWQPFTFGPDGLTIAQSGNTVPPQLPAPYSRLVLIEYRADHTARILDNAWLKQQAPKGVDVSAYAPPTGQEQPGEGTKICSLLERDMRPGYCD